MDRDKITFEDEEVFRINAYEVFSDIRDEIQRDAYDISDPKHPDHHDIYSEISDTYDERF